jgi:hypothetical protein
MLREAICTAYALQTVFLHETQSEPASKQPLRFPCTARWCWLLLSLERVPVLTRLRAFVTACYPWAILVRSSRLSCFRAAKTSSQPQIGHRARCSGVTMLYPEPCMLSSLSVVEAPPCCVRVLSTAQCCPRRAIALPIIFSAPMMSQALVMPARRRCSVCWRKGRPRRGQLSRGLFADRERNRGRFALRRLPLVCLRRRCDVVNG